MFLYFYLISFMFILNSNFNTCTEKKAGLRIERTKIVFVNQTYLKDVSVTVRKYNRTNKLRFATVKFELLLPVDNTFMMNFYSYQLLSNAYKRSFIEFHETACDVMLKTSFISTIIQESYYRMPEATRPMKTVVCPLQPGNYSFSDINFNFLLFPANFPFLEGRTYLNFTRRDQIIASGYFDFVIKLLK